MKKTIYAAMPVVAAAVSVVLTGTVYAGDPAAAERQYRIARRLAAENSPEAVVALQTVVNLDPTGPLADDALLDQAMLIDIPTWPSELGRLPKESVDKAAGFLRHILEKLPASNRAIEARYFYGLLQMEPFATQELSAARLNLLTVATTPGVDPWPFRARYVIAWLDQHTGQVERARAAYQRLLVDHFKSEVADRARIGLARLHMRQSEYGEAAVLLQQVLERNDSDVEARLLRELAVRSVLREAETGGGWSASAASSAETTIKSAADMAVLSDGRSVVIDRKRGTVIFFSPDGRPMSQKVVQEAQRLAIDPFGRLWLAAGDRIYLYKDGAFKPTASQGRYAPVSAMAVDGTGTVWVADRRGSVIGKIDQGQTGEPKSFWENPSARIRAMAWDGSRLLVADEKGGRVLALMPDGTSKALGTFRMQKPISLGVDPAGQITVLDSRAQQILLLGPAGAVRDRISTGQFNSTKPTAIDTGMDGSLQVFDSAGGRLVRIP